MYYSVSFRYAGPFGAPEYSDCNEALTKAERQVEGILKNLGVRFKHQYSWPDGSLFKWIDSDLPIEVLTKKLRDGLVGSGVDLDSIRVDDPYSDPWKDHFKTLREYMTAAT